MSGDEAKMGRRFNVRVSDEIYETYEELARAQKTTVSAVVRGLLEQAAPLMGQLAIAVTGVEEAVARKSAVDALHAVRVFQGVAEQIHGGAVSMAGMGDMMAEHLERVRAAEEAGAATS